LFLDDDGSILGRFNLVDIDDDGTAELGYRIAEQVAGRGVATAGVQQVCRLAASEHSVRKLQARTTNDNVASQRVLSKAGFVANGESEIDGQPALRYELALKPT
jgi:ribosomal-protein-alanine N-acetyltransferase